jgi:hypothetical protein
VKPGPEVAAIRAFDPIALLGSPSLTAKKNSSTKEYCLRNKHAFGYILLVQAIQLISIFLNIYF